MRQGFSVFTPMVGTLVILITMLIVSSIILSERVSVQGSVKSYRSSELVNIAGEAQSRVVEEVRSAITSQLEEADLQGRPTMAITVEDCPNPEIADAFYPEPQCGGGDCVCDDAGTGCAPEQTCLGNTIYEVNATASNQLTGKALLETSIEHMISGIVSKYALINITANQIDFSQAVTGVTFLDCSESRCDDGRLRIEVDFSALEGTPIAEVASEGKRLQVFMPAERRVYTTHEPFMRYALMTSEIFSGLELFDPTWHGAREADAAATNGSEWYHYRYATQERYYGTDKGAVTMATAWNPGFKGAPERVTAYFSEKRTLSDFIVDEVMDQTSGITTEPYTQNLRLDNRLEDDLIPFISGYALTQGLGMTTLQVQGQPIGTSSQQSTIFPGGCIDASGADCVRSGAGNCLANDATFGKTAYRGNTTLVNTTADYDSRILGAMPDTVNGMLSDVRSNEILVTSIGVARDALQYNLTVESRQYYTYATGHSGGDNWHCGQFLTVYQITTASDACDATRAASGLAEPITGSGVERCSGAGCPWFVSEPVNWTCDSETLYRVEEAYRLYRSTPAGEEPDRPVFAAAYTRIKDDYSGLADGEHDYTLWTEQPGYSDAQFKQAGLDTSQKRKTTRVRECVYSYSTLTGDTDSACEWVSQD